MSQDKVNDHRDPWKQGQEFWNSTIITSLSHGAKDLWKNPRITMIRIEVLVSLVAGVLLLLAIFGSQRRRSRNGFLQKGVFGAFTLSFSVATYILGSMQSSGVKSSMYPIWAISLMMLHGCTDSITAYSVNDHKQRARLGYEAYMYFAYATLLLVTVHTVYTGPLAFMAFISFVRYAQKLAASALAGYSWNFNKIVSDYMHKEQNMAVFTAMKDCKYLVEWPISKSKFDAPTYATQLTKGPEKDEVINIGNIWGCEDMPLVQEQKDTCLSFSLFHLLRSRCFGFVCDEYKDSAHNFVFGVLLVEDYNRVFKVIEVELAFMYDFFFTKYAVIYYGSIAATVWSLVSVIGMSITAYITARTPVKISHGGSIVKSTITDDIVITIVILASTALLEFLQLLFYWMGIWGRVSFVCQSIREQARLKGRASQTIGMRTRGNCYNGIMGFLSKIGVCLASRIMGLKKFLANFSMSCLSNGHYWQHQLGQYSLLDSVDNNTSPLLLTYFIHWYILTVLRVVYLRDPTFVHPINSQALKVRKKAGKFVELPAEVRKAVIDSLKRSNGTLSNGKSLLEFHGAKHLSWACEWVMHPDPSWSQRKQNQTHIILTWHIATWYCEMITLSPDGAAKLKEEFIIATKLSRYCAYLVVCVPRLLPGHHYDTRQKFDSAALEAIELLKSATWTYEDMKSSEVPKNTKKIFESGVKLGKQLEELPEVTRWNVMADFWAEMILYLAPSDNVKDHIEQLAQGGEFITHLWALLSHAGIVKREQQDQAGEVRPTPSASSCIVHTGDLEAGP